ncbi:MAG: hypothetical protein ABR573_06760 [Candidatus Dormibacteria bacterium]
MPVNTEPNSRSAETRLLFRVALVIFTVTVAIGIFNGFHIITISRSVLLTHVHAGTLGWITLVALAAAYWLYGGSDVLRGHARGVALGMVVCVPLYVLAFLSAESLGNLGFVLRAVFGAPVLLLIVGIVVYLLRAGAEMTVPRLGVLLSFVVLIIGSTLGVLLQIQIASKHSFLPGDPVGGHASAQVGGYLVLFALSTIEWRLKGPDAKGIAGRIQVVLLFLGGILLAIGVLYSIQPLLGIFIPLDIIALVIFLVRVGPRLLTVPWGEGSSARHYAIAVPWAVVNLALTIAFVAAIIGAGGDTRKVNFGVIVAADHAIFLGVMTNVAFALMHDFSGARSNIAPWAEHVIFWGLNVALIGFIVSLVSQAQWAEKFFAPVQGTAILIGIIVFSMRLAEVAPPAAARA